MEGLMQPGSHAVGHGHPIPIPSLKSIELEDLEVGCISEELGKKWHLGIWGEKSIEVPVLSRMAGYCKGLFTGLSVDEGFYMFACLLSEI